MTGPSITTSSGLQVPLLDPRPHDINLRDLAHHTATINRFSGAPPIPFSVAQHQVFVASMLETITPRLGFFGLNHDSHEFVLGDQTTPVDIATFGPKHEGKPSIREKLKARMDLAIFAHFRIDPPNESERRAIDLHDRIAFATEWRDIMPAAAGPCPIDVPPARTVLKPWPWHVAEQKYLEKFDRLSRLLGLPSLNAPTGILK